MKEILQTKVFKTLNHLLPVHLLILVLASSMQKTLIRSTQLLKLRIQKRCIQKSSSRSLEWLSKLKNQFTRLTLLTPTCSKASTSSSNPESLHKSSFMQYLLLYLCITFIGVVLIPRCMWQVCYSNSLISYTYYFVIFAQCNRFDRSRVLLTLASFKMMLPIEMQ